jgi:hypothetical protein
MGNIHRCCATLGLLAVAGEAAVGQHAQPVARGAGTGGGVTPIRVARVGVGEGRAVFLTDWMEYAAPGCRSCDTRIFDCFGDIDSDGRPDDSGGCGMDGERWFFGTGYCGPLFYANDMTVVGDTDLDAGASRCDLAWYWTAGGGGTSERCIVGVFTQESVPCDPNTFDYEGWLVDFGLLPSGGYYYADLAFGPGAWTLPASGTGSYFVAFLRDVTTSGAWVLATCAQPMLWGTGDAGGAADMIGSQGPAQLEESELSFSQSSCASYAFSSLCPSVLGGMAQFWGRRDQGCVGVWPDCVDDDVVDQQDFLCYLTKWSDAFQTGTYDPEADCRGDGVIDTQDFLCYLCRFAACFEG